METIPPALKTLLVKCFPATKIVNCSISSGSNPGDNVIGKMLSVKITTVSGENHDLVVKASVPFRNQADMTWTPEEVLWSRLVEAIGFFYTELAVYQRILPGLSQISKTENFGLPTPKIYYGQDGKEDDEGRIACLILDDLRPQGYKMADKFKGLSLDEVNMVLEKIAKFHAASHVYLKRNQVKINDKADPLATHIFNKMSAMGPEANQIHENFLRKLCFGIYELGKETKAISEELYQKIVNMTQNPQEVILSSSVRARDEYFPVVIHGDLWINNILFKYDDQGNPIDVKFIDFQQSRYSSVYDELYYFLYTSTTTEFRKKNLDICLNLYYKIFRETLSSLGNDPNDVGINNFTPEALLIGFKKYLQGAFCYNIIAIPFQLGMPPSPPDTDGNATEKEKVSEGGNGVTHVASQSSGGDKDDLLKFITKTFDDMVVGLLAGAKNSPPALKRLAAFCEEMDALGAFK